MEEKIISALGYFDGVHIGHMALLKACRELAQAQGCKCGVVTFLDHPDTLLQGRKPALITTPAQREKLLRQQGMQTVLQLPFDEKMMGTPWQEFLTDLVQKYDAAGFVCGSDFRFGKGGEGTADSLGRFCDENRLAFSPVPQQYIDGIRVSSTHIRGLLRQGQMAEAARFAGRGFTLSGTVIRGQQLGRTLGFPTANLPYPEDLVRVPFGVYACRVLIGGTAYQAVTNIGSRPTVSGTGVTVESHILDFSGDLYGKRIDVELLKFLRPEQKFASLQELQAQIDLDRKAAEQFADFKF